MLRGDSPGGASAVCEIRTQREQGTGTHTKKNTHAYENKKDLKEERFL